MLFPRVPRLKYFKAALELDTLSNLKILDFGGNRGNILEDGVAAGELNPADYTCLDLSDEALTHGRSRFPNAAWVKYNPLNWHYNPTGNPNSRIPFNDNTFDIVCAYSVHSHCTFEMLVHELSELYRVCKPDGKIVTTILTKTMMPWFMHKRKMNFNVSPNINSFSFENVTDYAYYIDDKIITKKWETKCDQFLTIYNEEWLLATLPYNSKIINHVLQKVRDMYQTALVIQKHS